MLPHGKTPKNVPVFLLTGRHPYLLGPLIVHDYEEIGDIIEFQKNKLDIVRTKDFDDPELTAGQIADNIEQYLVDKGFAP